MLMQVFLCLNVAAAITVRTQSVDAYKTNCSSERPMPLDRKRRSSVGFTPIYIYNKKNSHVFFPKYHAMSPQGRDALKRPGGEWHLLKDKLGFQSWKVTLFLFLSVPWCREIQQWDVLILRRCYSSPLFCKLFVSCLAAALSEVAVKLMQFSVTNLAGCQK